MIEKFFGMERILASFIITIAALTVVAVGFAISNLTVDDYWFYILAGIIFTMTKLLYANNDYYKEKNIKEKQD